MPKDCRDTALHYLEHRERSAHEVRSHLLSKGFGENEIEEELKYLQEYHYVDDLRYCGSYIDYGIRKGRGPVRLRYELSEKGIDYRIIEQMLKECFDRDTEKACALKEARRLLTTDEPDKKTLAKIGRKLASLGYHSDIIYDLIGRFGKP